MSVNKISSICEECGKHLDDFLIDLLYYKSANDVYCLHGWKRTGSGVICDDCVSKKEKEELKMQYYIEKITKLCQGNPGALTILKSLLFINTECIDILERYNICGSDIWQLYKDCCHENMDFMVDVLNKLPPDNIKYHINNGHRGIEYDKNFRKGNVDDWIIMALHDFQEYNIYARMELENFGVLPAQPPETVGSHYSIWIKTRNQKKLRFNLTMEQLMDMKLNVYITYLLGEVEKFCKHNSLRDAMKLDEAIEHCREIANQCEISNKDRISAGFVDTCAKDHLQLMEWLMELKQYKMKYGELE